ncbi:hypothetical protein DU002_09175, partial [Corallincola holothuriorum]
NCADGSVGLPHVRVGHRQTPNKIEKPFAKAKGFFISSAFSVALTWGGRQRANGASLACASRVSDAWREIDYLTQSRTLKGYARRQDSARHLIQ